MGLSKSKGKQLEKPGPNATFFERELYKQQKHEMKTKKLKDPGNRRKALPSAPTHVPVPNTPSPVPMSSATSSNIRSYDDDAIERMNYQLDNDSDAFLLNNILLSVQFFENFER